MNNAKMLCGNTHYLNEYEIKQDQAERDWENSIDSKRAEIVSKAIRIMCEDCSDSEFDLAFDNHLEDNYSGVWDILYAWGDGEELSEEDNEQLKQYAESSLDASACILFDMYLDEFVSEKVSLEVMVEAVISGNS